MNHPRYDRRRRARPDTENRTSTPRAHIPASSFESLYSESPTYMLSRRGSSQAASVPKEPRARLYGTLSLRAPSRNGTISSQNPRLPWELLDRIIECYFDNFSPGSLRLMHDHVKIIRLCCHAFNEAALRHVFKTIVIISSGFWTAIVNFLSKEANKEAGKRRLVGFAWVR